MEEYNFNNFHSYIVKVKKYSVVMMSGTWVIKIKNPRAGFRWTSKEKRAIVSVKLNSLLYCMKGFFFSQKCMLFYLFGGEVWTTVDQAQGLLLTLCFGILLAMYGDHI